MKKLIAILLLFVYVAAFVANKTMEKTVAFDYDLTLSYSTPTFQAEQQEEPSKRLEWELINGRLLQLEKRKRVASLIPLFKALGYTPIVITARPEIKGDVFRAHVSRVYGIKTSDIYMTKDKAEILKKRRTVLFLGDSDSDITEAKKAGVMAIRVKRSGEEQQRENYNPGEYGEWVLPFSEGHD